MKLLIRSIACILLFGGLLSCEEDSVSPPYKEYESSDTTVDGVSITYWHESSDSPLTYFDVRGLKSSKFSTAEFDFGDSSELVSLRVDSLLIHRYQFRGLYWVQVRLIDSLETRIVNLRIDHGADPNFSIQYFRDVEDSLEVHFDVRIPPTLKNGVQLVFGDGTKETVIKSKRISHQYPAPKEYYFSTEYTDSSSSIVRSDTLLNLRNRAGSGTSSTDDLKIEYALVSQDSMLIMLQIAVGPKAYGVLIEYGDSLKQVVRSDRTILYKYGSHESFTGRVYRLNEALKPTDLLSEFDLNFSLIPPDVSKLIACKNITVRFVGKFEDDRRHVIEASFAVSDTEWADGSVYYKFIAENYSGESVYKEETIFGVDVTDDGRFASAHTRRYYYVSNHGDIQSNTRREVGTTNVPFDHEDQLGYHYVCRGPFCKSRTQAWYNWENGNATLELRYVKWNDPDVPPEVTIIFQK
jgi:hypothetical protein